MAYRKGDPVAAADLNGFSASMAAIYGVGTGDRGYGRTTPAPPTASAGQPIASSGWTTLREIIRLCAAHQGTSEALLPPASLLAVGQTVVAHEQDPPSSNAYDLDGVISLVDTNRLVLDPVYAALVPSVTTKWQTTAWGTGGSQTISFTADYTWASEDAARHFFNTGGSLALSFSHPVTGQTKDDLWASGLAALGSVRFAARATARTGSGGTPSAGLGYYHLTDSQQTIFNGENAITGYGGTGSAATYTTAAVNDIIVQARRLAFVGTRGANGSGVRITVLMTDEMPGGPDIVSAGTAVDFGYLYATSFAGIPLPTIA